MKYAKQTTRPDWYQSDDSKIYEAATFGTNPSNEWYEFDDRQDALDLINQTFGSQTFIDTFINHNGDYYLCEEIIWDGDSIQNLANLEPAELGEMVAAESQF